MKLELRKMVKYLFLLFTIFILASFLVLPVLAQGETPPEIPGLDLSMEQLVIVGLITSALVVFFRFLIELLAKKKVTLPDWIMQLIVYLVSGGVAYLWFPPSVPALPTVPPGSELPDVVNLYNTFLAALLTSLSAFFVIAHLFYKWFIQKVREAIGQALMPFAFHKG